jgi:hypothetical protein
MRGAEIFYHFGVPGYVEMIENLYPKGTSCGPHNEAGKRACETPDEESSKSTLSTMPSLLRGSLHPFKQ